ncbi:MAG TPA: 5'/3'-nucleotidase SurE [Methanocorpusculum sp.]|nr:5'/3'-nucleotidase SurE [Methanocorpusculum sp.]
MHPKILLTNDDGVYSSGIWAAYDALSKFADVTVIAPATQQSAVGRSVSIYQPLRMTEVIINGHHAYSVEGKPTDSLLLGLYELNIKPDIVISGINIGENLTYDAITSSGTIGAAMEAANQGFPALAYSLQMSNQGMKFNCSFNQTPDFSPAKQVVSDLTKTFLSTGLPKNCHLLNINIPAGKFKGYTVTHLGSKLYNTCIEKRLDPRDTPYYWIDGDLSYQHELNSDIATVMDNKVSITPITLDNTAHSAIPELESIIYKR